MNRGVPLRSPSPGPPVHVTLSDNLRLAASRGQVEAVKDLLAAGATLEPDRDGRNPLYYAAQEGQAEMCKFLSAHGCDVNNQDVMGCSPLLRAAAQGFRDVVQVLLESGCNTNLQDEHGNAAIHEACWNGFSKTAEILANHNCDVFLTNKAGFTALHLAAQKGHNESSRVLLYSGCNADLKNNYGDTALHTAARYGHAGVARILISAKCKLSEQNKNGDTALHIAAALKRRKIAKILVESDIDSELINKQNETAFDVAMRKEHPEIMLIISTYAKCKPSSHGHQHREPVGVTFKEEIDIEDGPVVCPDDEPPLKSGTKVEKQEKERRFFFFKKKKKDKEKEKTPTTQTTGQKKTGGEMFQSGHGKSAVHGFFSQYVPRDGVQFYRDLAGNIKQGPIGYAPVCQCGPSLRRLEDTITDTRESLYNHIDASHHVLSQRIENLDITSKQQTQETRAMVNDRFNSERNACHHRISEHLDEERLETQAMINQANTHMKGDLEYWLNDKLASYGHCLDHHHDDTALPPRNLFLDFPTMGRLVRSRSDETLSASDCSGKFRKKDFYASRQAAMQQIRGWDVPGVDKSGGHNRGRRREQNNNTNMKSNNSLFVTQAQVHMRDSDRRRDNSQHCVPHHNDSNNPDVLSPSTNSTTSPGTMTSTQHTSLGTYGGTPNSGAAPKRGLLPWQQATHEIPHTNSSSQRGIMRDRRSSQPRVTFSLDQQHQHPQQMYQHPGRSASSPPPHGIPKSHTDPVHLNRQSSPHASHIFSSNPNQNTQQQMPPPQHHSRFSSHQNLNGGGPRNADMKSGEQGDPQNSTLTGQTREDPSEFPKRNVGGYMGEGVRQRLTRFQDNFGVHYSRPRTQSTDSLLNENDPSSSSQHIPRSHSVENTLSDNDQKSLDLYNSGYVTDSAVRPLSGGSRSRYNHNQRLVRDSHSESPGPRATTRYRLPQTSADLSQEPDRNSPYNQSFQETRSTGHFPHRTQSPASTNRLSMRQSECGRSGPTFPNHDSARDFFLSKTQHKNVHGLNDGGISRPTDPGELARFSNGKSDPVSRSESSLTKSQSMPFKECLQHDSLGPAIPNTAPTPGYVTGNKEDSTCSSNQDSGYGSRNHGGVRGHADTSGGTPSSSFSAERSGCNTPSNAGSPYTTQAEHPNSEYMPAIHGNTQPQQQKHYFNNEIHGSTSGFIDSKQTESPYVASNSNRDRSTMRQPINPNINSPRGVPVRIPPANNFNSYQQSSLPYDRSQQHPSSNVTPSQQNMHRNTNQQASVDSRAISSDPNSSRHNTTMPYNWNDRNFRHSNGDEFQRNLSQDNNNLSYNPSIPSHGYNTSYTPDSSRHFNRTQGNHMPQIPNRDIHTPVSQAVKYDNSSIGLNMSENNTILTPTTQDTQNLPQAAVQAHIQGWYQRKLMEAAHRLRENHSYNQPSFDTQSLDDSDEDTTFSPRPDSANKQKSNHRYPSNNQQPVSNHQPNDSQNYVLMTSSPRQQYSSQTSQKPQQVAPSSTFGQRQQQQNFNQFDRRSYNAQKSVTARDGSEPRSSFQNGQNTSYQNRGLNSRTGQSDRNIGRLNHHNSDTEQALPILDQGQTPNHNGMSAQNNNLYSQSTRTATHNSLPVRYDPVHGSDV